LELDESEFKTIYKNGIKRGGKIEKQYSEAFIYIEVLIRGKVELFYRMTSEENQNSTFELIIRIENVNC
jgi:hypothetical protein